jgi:dTDP-4-dehydrorhamnose 3,5-epimerase
MEFKKLLLEGAYIINLDKRKDERGFFARFWCHEEFQEIGLESNIEQVNNSYNRFRGTLRGLHFQYSPKCECKIVRCIKGSVWDVIVDIRINSDTYGKWFGTKLDESNRTMIYVPKGFAHGFLSLTDHSEIIYLATESYSLEHEGTLRWDDPFHCINWPFNPIHISEKDTNVTSWQDNNAVKL